MNPRSANHVRYLLVLVGLLLFMAHAQTATRLLLVRSDADIEIVNSGLAADGARSILRLAGCDEASNVRSNFFYAPSGSVQARIDRGEGEAAFVRAPLMIVKQTEEEPAEAVEGADDETLEALDATATFGRPPCLENVAWDRSPEVVLTQGTTTATGTRFFLDQGANVASLDGPIALRRAPQGAGPAVEATSEGLQYDLDAGRSTLSGGVQITAGTRVSEADALELDEEAGIAILTGSPAISRDGDDEVRGDRLVYDLETNDVIVEGRVRGSFQLNPE